jgi:hypothetical protein
MPGFSFLQLLTRENFDEDVIADEKDTLRRHRRLLALVGMQSLAIAVMTVVMILSTPVLRPIYIYKYRALAERHKSFEEAPPPEDLVPLYNPNLTNRALLSWAATSVTEIMTFGFGDFDRQLLSQRVRFTSDGWESFVVAVNKQKLRQEFKARQLILTTVPAEMPVIISQGDDPEYGYRWVVEMPIIMTYATNNNVTKKSRAIIRLTIVRVPGQESVGGVAIKTWDLVS